MHISNICIPQSRPPSDFFQNRPDHVTPLLSPHLADDLSSLWPTSTSQVARHISPASPVLAQAPWLLQASCCSSHTPVPPAQGL